MRGQVLSPIPIASEPHISEGNARVIIRGEDLAILDVVRVARDNAPVRLTNKEEVLRRVQASCDYITNAMRTGTPIYGVTTAFGGMANQVIQGEEAAELQNNLLWFLKAGTGQRLPTADVRAAMLLRAIAAQCHSQKS